VACGDRLLFDAEIKRMRCVAPKESGRRNINSEEEGKDAKMKAKAGVDIPAANGGAAGVSGLFTIRKSGGEAGGRRKAW